MTTRIFGEIFRAADLLALSCYPRMSARDDLRRLLNLLRSRPGRAPLAFDSVAGIGRDLAELIAVAKMQRVWRRLAGRPD